MPIRPELRKFYRTPQWRAACALVRIRAQGRCEHCGKPVDKWVAVMRDNTGRWNEKLPGFYPGAFSISCGDPLDSLLRRNEKKAWFKDWRGPDGSPAKKPTQGRAYIIKRPFSFAHVDHTPGHDDPSNVLGLCDRCHLIHDKEHHKDMRRIRKDGARPLFALVAALDAL